MDGLRVIALGRRAFVNAFRLAGVEGIEVSTPEDMLKTVRRLASSGDVGLILLSEDLADDVRVDLAGMRKEHPIPLLYELPPPGGRLKQIDYMQLVKEIVGV